MRLDRLAALYRRHFREHRRERMFLASVSFFLTFAVTRVLTHWLRGHEDPFRVLIGGTHVHHLVWGILLLLLVGYTWLIQVDSGPTGDRLRIGRLTMYPGPYLLVLLAVVMVISCGSLNEEGNE